MFRSVYKKSVVDSVNVTNSGSNYEVKTRTVQPVGVSTVLDSIKIENHDYNSGDVIKYTTAVSYTHLTLTTICSV